MEIGRGSPTGLVVLPPPRVPAKVPRRHFQRLLDARQYLSFSAHAQGFDVHEPEGNFLSPTGQIGFAPVDLAVGPAGDMFVAIGGRGTRGGVFRVRKQGRTARRTTAERSARTSPRRRPTAAQAARAQWVRKVLEAQRIFGSENAPRMFANDLAVSDEVTRHVRSKSMTQLFAHARRIELHAFRKIIAPTISQISSAFSGQSHGRSHPILAGSRMATRIRPGSGDLRITPCFADDGSFLQRIRSNSLPNGIGTGTMSDDRRFGGGLLGYE